MSHYKSSSTHTEYKAAKTGPTETNLYHTTEYLKRTAKIINEIKDTQLLLKGILKTSEDRELLLEALLITLIEKLDNHKEPAERQVDWDDMLEAMKIGSNIGTTATMDHKYWAYQPNNQIDMKQEIETLSNELKKQEIMTSAKPITLKSFPDPFTAT